MPPKTSSASASKKPRNVLDQILDPDDDSALRAAVANKTSRNQTTIKRESRYTDQHGSTTLYIFNNKSLFKGGLYNQHEEQSEYVHCIFLCLRQ